MKKIESKDMRKWLRDNHTKFDAETYDKLFVFWSKWKYLEDCADELFTIGEIEDWGKLILECPNNAIANSFIKKFDIFVLPKLDTGLWTYTSDSRQGSGNTPMEAFEQWRELGGAKEPRSQAR